LGGVGEFGDEERGGVGSKGEAETDEETRADEHADRLGDGLQDGSDDHEAGAEDDGDAATITVSDIGSQWVGRNGANGLNGVEEAQLLKGEKEMSA